MNKQELLEALEIERVRVFWEWNELETRTFNSDYTEEYEDTVTRLTLDGELNGIALAMDLIKKEMN